MKVTEASVGQAGAPGADASGVCSDAGLSEREGGSSGPTSRMKLMETEKKTRRNEAAKGGRSNRC